MTSCCGVGFLPGVGFPGATFVGGGGAGGMVFGGFGSSAAAVAAGVGAVPIGSCPASGTDGPAGVAGAAWIGDLDEGGRRRGYRR